ncbi:Serine/threonine protein kinase [Handroanthus impetiginosus]|uniref:Serine/threonine protein kinase n=1 Tax=Handroanthus impetiginosus TaxID=429701 RepID=A0A2G9HLJ9_9LAMI|nr:Serine/threonine protein kinase [Handroanthus impetiginosus]
MSAIYDNWERLVAAVLRREQLWQLFHEDSRTPSILSDDSSSSSSFGLGSFDIGNSSLFQKALPKLVLISDFSPSFGVNDLCMASAKLLGKGTFGSSYLAATDNGVRIVVKRLKSVSISEQEFKGHMDIVGNVTHENVAPLRAYYSSKDEQLLLYDYYSEGSVYALLHGQTGEGRAHVDWGTRLKIAIGASRDLGLANMIETTFGLASWCYAPELKSSRNVSQASDVYSFGIVLLELLTRKSTEHLPGGLEPFDLVKLVGSIESKETAAKVFDEDLLKHPSIKEDMVKMLQIGLKCVSKSKKKRPKMSEVVKMLDDIGKVNPESRFLFERKLVLVEGAIEVLGKGPFGTHYRARLENGNAIVVMRLRDVPIAFEEFQQHMEVIGGMRHENIVELRAYYFSRYEKLLVYDSYNQGSVFAALHGIDRRYLGWASRLKIAVGAARGIALIHRQDGGKLVHGNIKSSTIFINGEKYGAVTDFGLAKFMNEPPIMQTPNHCTPEVIDTNKMSQASDVYSFGIVLLELLTGKPSQGMIYVGRVISLVDWIKSLWNAAIAFDVELLRYPDDEEAMVQVLQIAMDCVAVIPERRPAMPEIVKMLEEISGFNPSNESSLEDALEEDTWGQASIESRLEDLLEHLLPTLTP